jgi:hypothetical protein
MHDVLFAVAHAPHAKSEMSAGHYWESLAGDVRAHKGSSACQVLLTDANAQLRSERAAVSEHASYFRGFLEESQFQKVTGSGELGVGEAPLVSYLAARGLGVQLDYVAVQGAVTSVQGSARTIELCASFAECRDHIMVAVDVVLELAPTECTASRRALGYSRSSLSSPEVSAVLAQALEMVPLVDRDVEPSSHCHIIDEAVRKALVESAPRTEVKKPRAEFMSDSTFALVLAKSREFRRGCRAGRALKRGLLSCL